MLGEHRTSKETSKVGSSSTTVVDSTVPSTTAFNTTNYHRRTYRVQTPIFNPLKILMTFFSLEVLCVLYLTGSVLIFFFKKSVQYLDLYTSSNGVFDVMSFVYRRYITGSVVLAQTQSTNFFKINDDRRHSLRKFTSAAVLTNRYESFSIAEFCNK